jgi:hypothetical protein
MKNKNKNLRELFKNGKTTTIIWFKTLGNFDKKKNS